MVKCPYTVQVFQMLDVIIMMIISVLLGLILLVLSLVYEKRRFGVVSTFYTSLSIVTLALVITMLFLYIKGFSWMVVLLDYVLAVTIVLITYAMILKR